MSERRACRVLGQARAVQRYTPQVRDDEGPLRGRVLHVAIVVWCWSMIAYQLLSADPQYWPIMLRVLDGIYVESAWGLMVIAAVVLYIAGPRPARCRL